MKKLIISFAIFLASFNSTAHPGIGIVKDSKGNIYYTDLKYVWKITPDGNKTIVVSNVHTHELYMDTADNLYGEHLWYNGEKTDTWGHYVWCLKNDGSLVKVKEPAEGFLEDYSFARDDAGNMYWVQRGPVSKFKKKSPDGNITVLAEGKFGFIGWLYCIRNGIIYFTENNTLKKLSPDGSITLLADNLKSKRTDFSVMRRNYDTYGIWTDAENNVYVAMIDAKKVNRITPGGKVETIFHSTSIWTVCSGVFDNDGNLWVLENSATNEVRVRKLDKQAINKPLSRTVLSPAKTHVFAIVSTGLAIVITGLLLNKLINKPRLEFV
ncbi:MAG: hypothetical protein SFU87_11980 [Chitinophagaceae bacterium]|nr:hypothetical protein [Chitinophagaceae bacterium]